MFVSKKSYHNIFWYQKTNKKGFFRDIAYWEVYLNAALYPVRGGRGDENISKWVMNKDFHNSNKLYLEILLFNVGTINGVGAIGRVMRQWLTAAVLLQVRKISRNLKRFTKKF